MSGGFDLFVKGHISKGNTCRYITFFESKFGFKEDLCFNLRLMPDKLWINKLRIALKQVHGEQDVVDLAGDPPFWKTSSKFASLLFRIRDFLNSSRIEAVISEHGLNDYDLYHFEQGVDPFRDCRWIQKLSKMGKGIVSFYHGSDFRNRGLIKGVHEVSQLNLTSEIDLLHRMNGMKYLFLPIDTEAISPRPHNPDGRIRIGHAARNRKFKGSDFIEKTVEKLQEKYPIDWIMIENVSHQEALEMKSECDIFIDQITDAGGWGYGASSVESLSMGIATMTLINEKVNAFLAKHPFVEITQENLNSKLITLIEDTELREQLGRDGRKWVEKTHSIESVMGQLYGYYKEAGLI